MKLLLPVAAAALLVSITSCTKESIVEEGREVTVMPTAAAPLAASATYKIILTGQWQAPAHTVPAGNHFTAFNGLVHNSNCFLFKAGFPATLGVENVAEVGSDAVLKSEMDSYIAGGNAIGKFRLALGTITSVDSAAISLTQQHSLISFASMIAPSPDWFAGLDSYNLIQNGKWVSDITISIAGYDAGTEDGDVFGYNNPSTNPQQNVTLMTTSNASVIANGNSSVAPFASLRLIRQ